MPHATPLITTIVGGLCLAFLLGTIAYRFRISPLVGYLLAGVLVGPWTPGFVADRYLIGELAEIGVILLMFGVGLHFSLKDLLSVKYIAIPGALVQIAVATVLGMGLAAALGWPVSAGVVFGLALSTASTVVLLRAVTERKILETDRGRIAVGWLIVEDLVMVLALVLLPALASAGVIGTGGNTVAGGAGIGWTVLLTVLKVVAFIALMLLVGRRVIPWLLHWVAHTGSRELFRLAVLALALGVAYGASKLFDVSFALGAFFAGMVLAESELSHRAAHETLPLRDAFAVLFFVSVGMLFNPATLIDDPLSLLATLAIILVGKSMAAFALVRLFGYANTTAMTISASLAQIGEFSFILAVFGVTHGVLPEAARDLILAGAIFSILLNPLAFMLVDYIEKRRAVRDAAPGAAPPKAELTPFTGRGHTVLVGYGGRIGRMLADRLRARNASLVVLEARDDLAAALQAQGVQVLHGNAATPEVLAAANIAAADVLLIDITQAFEAGQIVAQSRALNAGLKIVVHAHDAAEAAHFVQLGANTIIDTDSTAADAMLAAAGTSG